MNLKKIIDALWIISSLSFYLLFFLLTKQDTVKIINLSIKEISIDGAWLVFIVLLVLPLLILLIYHFFIKADENINIANIKPAEINYIPTYIGYFVIATSISNLTAFYIISIVIAVLIKYTRMFYFNPVLLFIGYQYYEVIDTNGVTISLITREKDLKNSTKLKKIRRLNNYTFIGGEEELDD